MTNIDTTKPVLVTGATGYVAGWLVKKLLEEGCTVHAAVRNPDKKEKLAHLDAVAAKAPGTIKYFKADLLTPGAYKEAMEGCELVYHTASPFTYDIKDPQKELVEPAVQGTTNVLETANVVPSVKKVVVTSSCVSIYNDATDAKDAPGGVLNEDFWNNSASLDYQPYSLSKTLAEKKAWEIAKNQDRWELVTINPSFVLGPPLNPTSNSSESMNILKQMGDGTYKSGFPKLSVGMVDVRDVAEAHYKAGFVPQAKGRYITSGHNTDFYEMGMALREKYGDQLPLGKGAVPKWLLMIMGPFIDKKLSRRFIKNNMNVPLKLDNSKIKKDLGMTFRPMAQTMQDGMQALIEEGIVKTK
ncbi:MAG: NAD-dependent epimerase/dehydratase family protein [Saprospiraceae bacterium]|nr:NAD-dependent epimerase/dehydratase family protein [Saprospiraceae bacterium]